MRRQAEYVLSRIAAQMSEAGLRSYPDNSLVSTGKDGRRRAEHEHTFHLFGYAVQAGLVSV
jgi:hypothetical protein